MDSFDSSKVKGRSVNEKAYQIAWMVMRHELEYDDIDEVVGSIYGCIVYDGLLERIHATLDGGLSPEEERLALKGESVLPLPEADQVNTSICPGVSTRMNRVDFALPCSSSETLSNRVAKRFSAVTMPPLGPRLYCLISSL